jgi:uroporphyrinogen-III synthase
MGEIEGVILMSPQTATTYAALMRKQGLASVARGLIHFCLSEAIARRLQPLGAVKTEIADAPRLEEVLALIDAAAAKSAG